MDKKTSNLLMKLGITSNYYGHLYIITSIRLLISGEEDLLLITKRLYPHIARLHNTSASCVERNIRHASEIAWNTNPQLICDLAGRELSGKPTVGEFLAILYHNILYGEE